MADIWAKIGGAVKKGAETTKDVLLLVPKALIYPIKKPFASLDEMKHDATVSLKEAVGMDVPEKEREYDPPIETTQASKNLGVEIISYKDGKIKFLASRALVGDVSHLSPEQLGQIEALLNVDVFRGKNKVVIEVDVKDLVNEIKTAPENKGKSPEEIKGLIIKQIKQKVDGDLKKLAEITGREFKVHTDPKLLHGIAEKLYREYDEQLSKAAKSTEKSPEQSSESITESFNITNPSQFPFPFGKETISPTKIQLSQDIKEGLEGVFNFKDVSPGEQIESPSTSAIRDKKEGGEKPLKYE